MQQFNRIRISEEATTRLRTLKMRTGLTPNLLCRIALAYSLNGEKPSDLVPVDEHGQEFNRYTLTGEYDAYFVALVKQRCVEDGLNPESDFIKQFKIHLNHGILTIYSKLKSLADLVDLMEESRVKASVS